MQDRITRGSLFGAIYGVKWITFRCNSTHWVLDVSFREDESRIRRGHGAEVMSTLRRLTLNLLKKNTTSKASLILKRIIAAMIDKFLTELIEGNFFALAVA